MALRKTEHALQATSLGLETEMSPDLPQSESSLVRTSLEIAIQDYLTDLGRFRAAGTLKGARHMLTRFSAQFPGRYIEDISRKDLLHHIDRLKEDGLGDTTISNHLVRIGALLRAHGIKGLLNATDKPKPEEKEVEAYDSEQLAILFDAATAEEKVIFRFFLGRGFKEKEVMFFSWRNTDFKAKVVKVRSKPEMGFKIKDKQERSVNRYKRSGRPEALPNDVQKLSRKLERQRRTAKRHMEKSWGIAPVTQMLIIWRKHVSWCRYHLLQFNLAMPQTPF